MKNKKGFVFVETIVVLTLVALSLSIVLITFSLITRKTKIKEKYNQSSDLYLLYNITKISDSFDPIQMNDFWINKNNCSSMNITNCSDLFTDHNIQNIGLFSNIDNIIKNNTYDLDLGVREFLNTLKKYYDEGKTKPIKYIVMRIYKNKEYYYAALKVGDESE